VPSNLRGMITAARLTLRDLSVRSFPEPFFVGAANEGKNELAKIIRQARESYFEYAATGTITATSAPNPSEITLPDDFSELLQISITNVGYEDIGFIFLRQSDPRFHQALIDGGSFGSGAGVFYYDIVGLKTLRLAPGADIALTYAIKYTQIVADMTLPTDAPTAIPADYYDYIVTWMVCEALRSVGDQRLTLYLDKLERQKNSTVASVNARQVREPMFVRGYMESEESW